MYLIFDTETSDLPKPALPLDHRNQARIVQLGFVVLDKTLEETVSFKSYVKINGKFDISDGAAERHHITAEVCNKDGIEIEEVIRQFFSHNAEKFIAFNVWFDRQLIDIECGLIGCESVDWDKKAFCAMLTMTNICKIPHPRWRGKFKWPKLQEAYRYCFNEDFSNAHDALADVRATARIFKWLVEKGHYKV